jgi:hypothetical protein
LLSLRGKKCANPFGPELQVKRNVRATPTARQEEKMYTIQRVDSPELVGKVHNVITQAFITVAQEFNFTKESVPTFPAFIEIDVINK